MKTNFDVVIIGGSYAGLSAAMALGRALRDVLIVDSGKPCNRQTPHAHNFITHDGDKPATIAQTALQQVLDYPTIGLKSALALGAVKEDNLFKIMTDDGVFTARKILFATGILDIMPDIPGFDDCWGISVLHCPYCHGYEVRNEPTALFANGEIAYEFGKIINHWTKELTLLTNGPSQLTPQQIADLRRHKINIIEEPLTEVVHEGGYLRNLRFADGSSLKVNAIYAKLPIQQHCSLPQALGCELTEAGFIKIDEFQSTSVAGVFAAGDNTTMFRSLPIAIAAGNKAGALINHQLIQEDF
ncbi:NAD(P)/FAD-dependent oxidoreductase [Mucilaginibacter terrenus]|uniref:NAD(P)/FAD-dependent oxidoreductase n=1 Tax=Mucilaginibacter terrenus TaxID=2482727 RepID=A0A3E2NTA4_9SPHI|nr:NAD(P)/FAD-dependent oxidoreductase [Mucilaginibacter terrenus]RFZ84199.1 NAD(P)/FAD-dependent oxidoreductase [Mucilaginibacter terrenus]